MIEEADESELWLDILETRRHQPADQIKSLRREAVELRAIFGASRRTAIQNEARARAKKRQNREKQEANRDKKDKQDK